MTLSHNVYENPAVLLNTDDLAGLLGFKGTPRQQRKQVYGLLAKEGSHFGAFQLNGRLVCLKSRVIAHLNKMADHAQKDS